MLPSREAELRQIRKATLLGTVNNLVFGGGPIIISLAGEWQSHRGQGDASRLTGCSSLGRARDTCPAVWAASARPQPPTSCPPALVPHHGPCPQLHSLRRAPTLGRCHVRAAPPAARLPPLPSPDSARPASFPPLCSPHDVLGPWLPAHSISRLSCPLAVQPAALPGHDVPAAGARHRETFRHSNCIAPISQSPAALGCSGTRSSPALAALCMGPLRGVCVSGRAAAYLPQWSCPCPLCRS